ncbi:N-acetyltransferase [Conexibacter sp. DBS9H8]|uniref:GNAT family N-acetyltransferase n=1 Tax=Conexibacter sp. DBS9H8 TaxID=2937801 RepID=UPI00200FBC4B|nr:GNAT family N-acetyltransferase [Conexibacter sp. DBS9H8]
MFGASGSAASAGDRGPLALDLDLVDAIEQASLRGWPPTIVESLSDGWILRATPGLDRGRSCHALTPRRRALAPGELPEALARIRAWSALHGIRGGLQVSPLELHVGLAESLGAAGWTTAWRVWVMAAARDDVLALGRARNRLSRDGSGVGAAEPVIDWCAERSPTPRWLAHWAACEPSLDADVIAAHAATVFAHVDGRGVFGRLGEVASGIVVEDGQGDWAGLFSLVVAAAHRGRGLGRELVLALVEEARAASIYLQVAMDNPVAIALYERLGFQRVYSYQHLVAPARWASGA